MSEKPEEIIEKPKRGRPKKETTVIKKTETKKGNLNLQFIPDSGDEHPPKIESVSSVESSSSSQAMTIDYEATARGFLQMIDMIFNFIAMVSSGQIEYEKLSEKEFKAGTNALVMEKKVLEMIASQSWAIHAIVMMQLVGVFAPRIKLKKKKKKEKEDEEIPKKSATEMKSEQVKIKITESQEKEIEKLNETVKDDNNIFLDDTMNIVSKENAKVEDLDNSSGELDLTNPSEVRDKNYGEPVEGTGTKLVMKKK